jgi:hypothetical protein
MRRSHKGQYSEVTRYVRGDGALTLVRDGKEMISRVRDTHGI